MKQAGLGKSLLAISAVAIATLFSVGWSEQGGLSLSVQSAQARARLYVTPYYYNPYRADLRSAGLLCRRSLVCGRHGRWVRHGLGWSLELLGENSKSTLQWKDVPRGTMDEVSSHVRLDLPSTARPP